MSHATQQVEEVVIRFAGDSGDGMQLTGGRFTETTAVVGNDLSTLPDFPAEIRAPAGSLAGVSAFQIHFSSKDVHTPGDKPDVLVAMNPTYIMYIIRFPGWPYSPQMDHRGISLLYGQCHRFRCLNRN